MFELVLDKFSSELAAAAGGAAAGIFLYGIRLVWGRIKKYREEMAKKRREEEIPKLVKKDVGVYRDLTELLVKTKADRAYVLQFHNGSYYVNQSSQMKLSCTHEIVRSGVSREQDSMQEVLVSKLAGKLDILSKENSAVFVIDETDQSYYGQMKKSQGVAVSIAAFMRDGNLIEGIVAINYLEGNDMVKTKLEKERLIVEEAAGNIGYLLRSEDEQAKN